MKATVIRIHPLKMSRTESAFIRIEFILEGGEWAKTDIVTKYRNYSRWIDIIKKGKGTTLSNLNIRRNGEVDGDSYPVIEKEPIPMKKREGSNLEQVPLFK